MTPHVYELLLDRLPVGPVRPDWMDDAACRNHPTDLFFCESNGGQGDSPAVKAAKQVCAGCAVRRECRVWSMDEPFGVWGGLTQTERARLRARHRRSGRLFTELRETV